MNPKEQFCPNRGGCDRGKIGGGNITIHSRKDERYRCKTCQQTFSATKGRLNKCKDQRGCRWMSAFT